MPPVWLDPAEEVGVLTPFWVLYALHDALVKPMPGNPAEPCLAQSYTASADGLSHSFDMLGEAARTIPDAARYFNGTRALTTVA